MMAIFPSLHDTFHLSLFLFVTLMFLICFKRIIFLFKTKKNLPPSPPKLPIIGNFHQIGSSPRHSLHALSKKYGPLMLIHLGSVPTLVASSAEVAQEILKTHDLSFSNRPNLFVQNILFYGSKDIAFCRYGEYWRQLKSIVVVHLLSSSRVKSFRKVREEEVDHMIGAIGESYGSAVDLSALFASLSTNIVCKVAFGRTYPEVGFRDLLKRLVDMLGVICVGSYIPWLSWIDRLSGLEGRARKVSKECDDFLMNAVEENINKRKEEAFRSEDGQDFVDILRDIQINNTTGFKLHTDSLKAVILDVFVAGIDTVFTALEWMVSELIRQPAIMKKLQQEVTEIAQGRSMIQEQDLDKMKYLKAVIKESLRLHPPLPLLIARESTQEVNLMGYDIPARTQVFISAWAIGRDPTVWEEPEEFRPDRFFNSSIDYKGVNFEWLIFGGGRRGCPGLQFAVAIMELALANLVYKFNFALPDGVEGRDLDMTESNGVTVQRNSPLLVMANPRV